MANTPSTMLPLGTPAPDFRLPDYDGRVFELASFAGQRLLLVMFICNHCPFVKHVRTELSRLCRDYAPERLAIVGINSNDAQAYPDDGPAAMAQEARTYDYRFPYLIDAAQSVAKAYRAACTPDFFVFDADLRCVYRGQFDDARPGNDIPPSGHDVRAALDALLRGEAMSQEQKPSIGCNIKWKTDH